MKFTKSELNNLIRLADSIRDKSFVSNVSLSDLRQWLISFSKTGYYYSLLIKELDNIEKDRKKWRDLNLSVDFQDKTLKEQCKNLAKIYKSTLIRYGEPKVKEYNQETMKKINDVIFSLDHDLKTIFK